MPGINRSQEGPLGSSEWFVRMDLLDTGSAYTPVCFLFSDNKEKLKKKKKMNGPFFPLSGYGEESELLY